MWCSKNRGTEPEGSSSQLFNIYIPHHYDFILLFIGQEKVPDTLIMGMIKHTIPD